MNKDKIIQARYGPIEYGQWVDVKPILDRFPDLRLEVCDIVFTDGEDLWPGKEKTLRVLIKEDRGNVVCEFRQGEIVPPDELRAPEAVSGSVKADDYASVAGLYIDRAFYGVKKNEEQFDFKWGEPLDVTERLRGLVVDNSLDIVVSNSTLAVGNPFRGKGKTLRVTYAYDGGESITVERAEKDWLIIGQARRDTGSKETAELVANRDIGRGEIVGILDKDGNNVGKVVHGTLVISEPPRTTTALNDYLIRKFSISPQRLRAPMPIELRDFHRNDLAALFAELGFKRGAEIGVAEGNYSEVLLNSNTECELLLVDPWHAYSENPQNKTGDKHKFAYEETKRKTSQYEGARMIQATSMEAVRDVELGSLDFCYIDGNHLFDYVMQDLIEWSKRVRSGGVISGDDYYQLDQKRWVGGGVVEAVNAYVNAHRIPVWYLFQGHKSVDFMWVKP